MEYIKETELVLVSILMKLGQKPLKFSKENIALGKIFSIISIGESQILHLKIVGCAQIYFGCCIGKFF